MVIRKNTLLEELEDVQSTEKQQTFKLIFPRRVWFKDNTKSFTLTDYCFQTESGEDAMKNLKSVWGEELDIIADGRCEIIKPLKSAVKGDSLVQSSPHTSS